MAELSQEELDALFSNLPKETPNPPPSTPAEPEVPPTEPTFPDLGETEPSSTEGTPIDLLADVPLEVTVLLGRTRRSIGEILAMGTGAVIELDNLAGEPVEILVNGRLVARGEVIVAGDNYGVRVVELVHGSGGPAE